MSRKAELTQRLRESKRNFPFDGLVKKFVDEHISSCNPPNGTVRSSLIAERIFSHLKAKVSAYEDMTPEEKSALAHLRLFEELNKEMGHDKAWHQYSWAELSKASGASSNQKKVLDHLSGLVSHGMERYGAYAGTTGPLRATRRNNIFSFG